MSKDIIQRSNELLAQNQNLKQEIAMMDRKIETANRDLNHARYQTKKAQEYYDFVQNSKTWRASAPLRKVVGAIKRIFR